MRRLIRAVATAIVLVMLAACSTEGQAPTTASTEIRSLASTPDIKEAFQYLDRAKSDNAKLPKNWNRGIVLATSLQDEGPEWGMFVANARHSLVAITAQGTHASSLNTLISAGDYVFTNEGIDDAVFYSEVKVQAKQAVAIRNTAPAPEGVHGHATSPDIKQATQYLAQTKSDNAKLPKGWSRGIVLATSFQADGPAWNMSVLMPDGAMLTIRTDDAFALSFRLLVSIGDYLFFDPGVDEKVYRREAEVRARAAVPITP